MRVSTCAAVLAAATGCAAQGAVIYQQSPFAGQGFSSTRDPTAVLAFLAADNFSISSPASVDQVRWWGNGDGFGSPDLVNFKSFTVAIYNRLGTGLPGGLVYQETFNTGATNPVNSGLISFNGTKVWQQTATLTTSQVLGPGQYMLSVGVASYVDNQGAIWFWNAATSGDGFLAYDAYDGNGWQQFTQQPIDLAFALISVPGPSGLGVIASFGLLLSRRRRTV